MKHEKVDERILVGVTGASGSIYAQRLVSELLLRVKRVYLVASDAALEVAKFELKPVQDGFSLVDALEGSISQEFRPGLRVFKNNDLFAPVASGSSVPSKMVVLPCSMGTMARIAHGTSGNLLERSADVVLKQKAPLIVCPRETPLSSIHLRNMLSLSDLGVHIAPLMPAFYQKPKSIEEVIDFMVGRVLELLGLDHKLYTQWNSRMI